MPSSQGFTADRFSDGLTAWLQDGLGYQGATVDLHDAPAATGHSSETVLFDATWTGADGADERRHLVLRTAPTGHTVFPTYDLGLQFTVMERVAATGAVPIPELFRHEADNRWIGSPFIVMARVDGQVPPDRLPYTMEGWLLESPVEVQRNVQATGLRTIAAVHGIDWRAAGLDVLDAQVFGATGLDQQLGTYEYFLEWGRGGHPQPRLHQVADWLRRHRPDPEPEPVLNWGDARIGNIIFRDGAPAAVLDWEMATLGPPQVDLAWSLLLERFFTTELGVPQLPGFLDHDGAVALYEEAAGREVGDLTWYTVWGAYRYAIVMMRITQAAALDGVDMGQSEDDNLALTMLDNILAEHGLID